MKNAYDELRNHIGDRTIEAIEVQWGYEAEGYEAETPTDGWLRKVLDREYDNGYGGQELYGAIWYRGTARLVRAAQEGRR